MHTSPFLATAKKKQALARRDQLTAAAEGAGLTVGVPHLGGEPHLGGSERVIGGEREHGSEEPSFATTQQGNVSARLSRGLS